MIQICYESWYKFNTKNTKFIIKFKHLTFKQGLRTNSVLYKDDKKDKNSIIFIFFFDYHLVICDSLYYSTLSQAQHCVGMFT